MTPNLSPQGEWTPLLAAVERGSLAVTQALLEAGADPAAVDPRGRTAVEIAREWAEKDLEAFLRAEAPRTGQYPEIQVSRRPLPDGTEAIEVWSLERLEDGGLGGGVGFMAETGHAEIVELLRRSTNDPQS